MLSERSLASFSGGRIRNTVTLQANGSYVINDHIVIESNAALYIEDGAILYFAPRIGITVYGKLIANASHANKRITFTRFYGSNAKHNSFVISSITSWPDVRLVDGNHPSEGRLQIRYANQWHSVCTNSKNWSENDVNTVCRQMGFESGSWYHWFDRNNDSRQFLFEHPNCTGFEDNIQSCRNWYKRKIGSGVCDYHKDIGIKCSKVLYPKPDHWKGIAFISANYSETYIDAFKMKRKISNSILRNVLITFAGEDENGKGVAAISSRGVPPQIFNTEVRWSAFNGIDILYPSDSVTIQNTTVMENRGFGIFINSSWGDVNLNEVTIENNGADGVYYENHQDIAVGYDFCRFTNLGENQVYPVRLTHEQSRFSESKQPCCQTFELPYHITPDAKLTAHFPYLMSEEFLGDKKDRMRSSDGLIEVYDGYISTPAAKFFVRNDTYPQSVTGNYRSLKICYTPAILKKVLFTVIVVSNIGRAYDLNITQSVVVQNNGKGIFVANLRSGVVLNHTIVANHSYIAGVHLLHGSGDVIVNNSKIVGNIGDGLNISLSGGYKHIDRSSITKNSNRGIAFWFNESSEEVSFTHVNRVSYSEVSGNGGIGLLMGNVCRSDSFWNVSMNKFSLNEDDAIVYLSCWKEEDAALATLLITHNIFWANRRLAIRMLPAFNIRSALLEHNSFRLHTKGTIYVNNYEAVFDDYVFEKVETNIIIRDNYFADNSGLFVANIGLNEDSKTQKLLFTKNIVINNSIREAYPKLNPRSRVAAVIAISSSNCHVMRNNLVNPDSKFELGTHLERHSKIINASLNYFGEISQRENTLEIYERIFDRKNRYNLAQIEFLPYRTQETDFDTTYLLSQDLKRDKFIPFQKGKELGGEVLGIVELPAGIYNVKKDLFVRSGSKLILNEGTEFYFDHSVGMMVQGHLEIRAKFSPITFTASNLVSDATYPVKSVSTIMKNVTSNNSTKLKNDATMVRGIKNLHHNNGKTVRLSNRSEGKVEVLVGNEWGSVCSYGFDIADAAVICQQLGLVLNQKDWLLEKSQYSQSLNLSNVILSNVQCTKLDTNILDCKAENRLNHDFENSCVSEVGIRCYQPSWSGLRMGIIADATELSNIWIQNAGLLDFSTYLFKPALQIDFNRHKITNVKINGNSDFGIGIMYNDVFRNRDDIIISDSRIVANMYHGLVIRSQGITISDCEFLSNRGSAIHYDPMTSFAEQKDIISWIAPEKPKYLYKIPSTIRISKTIYLDPSAQSFFYLIIETKQSPNSFQSFSLETKTGYSIGIMVLNPVTHPFTDKLEISSRSSTIWDLKRNLTAFPMLNYAYKLYVNYSAGDNPRGNIVLFLTVKLLQVLNPRATLDEQQTEENLKLKTIIIERNLLKSNGRGFSSRHYNREISDNNDFYHRYDNETILLSENVIDSNLAESVYVNSPFYDPLNFSLAEINYTLINNRLENNNQGIMQYSRDIRNSNNLFHWVINDSLITENLNGGIVLRLPYAWQFNENYTHSITINNNIFTHNKNFELSIDGHFARFNFTNNTMKENLCKSGLITISGMEKEMLIEKNLIEQNKGHYLVEFNLQSHADKFGVVKADFKENMILRNSDIIEQKTVDRYRPFSYALALRGVQLINITRNLMNNPDLQFEFIAGVLTGSLNNKVNVGYNWWGTSNTSKIEDRIFDFDDWNSYAIANFNPYLAEEYLGAIPLKVEDKDNGINFNEPFGGRLRQSVTLKAKNEPYIVKSDLTVLPDVTLTIEAGVVIEFFPSVGILVLGDMLAAGTLDSPIILRPVQVTDEKQRFKRKDVNYKSLKANDIGNVRLCYTESCDEETMSRKKDGFLEVYNETTLEWIPVCDERFTETNAEVVCKQLGFTKFNVHVKRGKRIDVGQTFTSRIRFWSESLECDGHENSLKECIVRLNGYGNHSHGCNYDDDFVYIYCGSDTNSIEHEYWGGIRFAIPSFEHKTDGSFYIPTKAFFNSMSKLESVQVINAGILHGEKNAAIQVIQRSINLENVKVLSSAHHGIEVIAPYNNLNFHGLEVHHNLGAGINYLLLNGDFSLFPNLRNSFLPYVPLKVSTLPYNAFSLVDICNTNKNLVIEARVLLYYKYSSHPVDCVKIIKSAQGIKNIGFRMLQFNLFNSTKYSAQPDSVLVYDGNIYNETGRSLLFEFGVTDESRKEQKENQVYQSSEGSLSVRLHASGAGQEYGFIAEVVILPVSYFIGRGFYNNLTYSDVSNNALGAIIYKTAGETSPSVSFGHNIFENNCEELYSNFTSCEAAVSLEVQNIRNFYFHNNILKNNEGGVRMTVRTVISASALSGHLANNLFVSNKKNEALFVQGSPIVKSLTVNILRNYFTYNYSPYKVNIVLAQILANFSQNIVVANSGMHQLEVLGFFNVPVQEIKHNWIYNNVAVRNEERTTIFARAVSGRIMDNIDDRRLIQVSFEPFLKDNKTVLSGGCAGGWEKIAGTCFIYSGGRMTFKEAKRFCESQNSTMPYVRPIEYELTSFLFRVQENYDPRLHKVWVRSFSYDVEDCTVLYNHKITSHNCDDRLPFLCEKDLDVSLVAYWYREPLGIAALTVSTITAMITLCCLICWLCKSREKYKEKLQRRNSIRASIRSNRSYVSSTSLSEANTDISGEGEEYDDSQRQEEHREYGEIEDRFANDPKLENANIDLMVRPTFDLTYENEGFKETSSVSRQSNVDSAEVRDWSPLNTISTVDTKAHSASPYAEYRPPPTRAYDYGRKPFLPHEYPKYAETPPFSSFTSEPTRQQPEMFTFRSQSSLVGAASDLTGPAPSERKYLETSLDGDSFVDTNYDYYDFQSGRLSPTSTTTASTNKSRPPLETAM
ncbi:uncharacterized protein B4U79_09122 [Dinothrombium tinctorium]|uniref:SRCR domain-containing protein n=1 Tax=Dinothrombium tinctorium TaxID=1965070 RepID=A0A443R3N9_9ACAR|nr:uncharacterized protein B4U79_09122 [Dinothrombium tinctorium]